MRVVCELYASCKRVVCELYGSCKRVVCVTNEELSKVLVQNHEKENLPFFPNPFLQNGFGRFEGVI